MTNDANANAIKVYDGASHALLQTFEPDAILTGNIWGYLWGKLGYGAMLFATALTPDSMNANFADPRRAIVFDTLGREVMAVAAARGVTPVGFDGYDPKAFLPGQPATGRQRVIDWLAAITAQSATCGWVTSTASASAG